MLKRIISVFAFIVAAFFISFLTGCNTSKSGLAASSEQNGEPSIIDASLTDRPPVPIFQPGAEYPEEMAKQNIGGKVLLSLVITKTGRVKDLSVVDATDIHFLSSAKTAVLKWRFRPALLKGRPVDCRLQVPVVFTAFHIDK